MPFAAPLLGQQPLPGRTFPALLALLTGLALALAARPAVGQPVPTLDPVPAIAVRQGESVEVTLGGSALAGVTSVGLADANGVEVSLVKPEQPNDGQAKMKITAAADAPPGERELRLIAPAGVTSPVRVLVDQYPQVKDAEPNNVPGQGQVVKLPAVIVGRIEGSGDVDLFGFPGVKGQRLVFDVQAARLGSGLDATFALYNSAGHEVASNNDHNGPDSLLVYDVPADGSYVLEVRDLQYRSGGNYDYRITAGPVPFLEAIVPMSSQRGRAVEVRAVGYNLEGSDLIKLDLTYAQPGRVQVRARTPLGYSNALPFEVTEVPPAVEVEPNDAADKATAVAMPADVTGTIQKGNDEDFYRFRVMQQQTVNVEVTAHRLGSPVDALLTLRDAAGNAIEMSDDAAGADSRITRDLAPGEYVASVRDLVYAGGPDHTYRLSIQPATGSAQDFSVRFLPDTPRLSRGGHGKLWCEVSRTGDYKGDVTVTLEGLPRGVAAAPAVFGESTSGVMTLAAAPDAQVGTFPIRLRASGTAGNRFVTREGQPELSGRTVREAYLTVLDAAPFTIEPLAGVDPARLQQFSGEIAALGAKLSAPDPRLDAAQAEWEKKVASATAWTNLDFAELKSAGGATLAKQPDGSVLASGANPPADTYTLVAHTEAKGIAAIRLETLTDPSLGANGPGRAPNGNFVLTRFAVTAAPKADPAKAAPVMLTKPRATFSQGSFDVAGAVDDNATSGWAISPETGKPQAATFFTQSPLGADGGTTLTFTLEQPFGGSHTLGKFRVSVTTDPAAADAPPVSEAIAAIAKLPAEQRTPEQKAQIAAYYRSIDPQLAADAARFDALRDAVAPRAEVARLEAMLNTQTPQLDAELAQWEQTIMAGAAWTPLDFAEMKSSGGATLAKESDGSLAVGGASPPTDTYTLTASTPVKNITSLRLEVLPDPRYPDGGPGRGPGGNFILTRVQMATAPKANAAQVTPVELHNPRATVEQQGMPVAGVLDDKNETGWAVGGYPGRPAAVTFGVKAPIPGGDENLLTLTLEQQSASPRHAIGRFRVWVTNAPAPDVAPTLPGDVLAILKTPAAGRTEPQKAALAAYFRSAAPSLEPVRQRLAELRGRGGPAVPVVTRNQPGTLPVLVTRAAGFNGDVQVTLEGFSSGRDENRMPKPIARSLTVNPLAVGPGGAFATLTFQATGDAEVGTRLVVLRAEAKVGNDTVVQYSPAFPMTVNAN